MKVLLDENLDHRLRLQFGSHEVVTVSYQGWSGLKNGMLLSAAEAAGFQVLVTADQTLASEQKLTGRRLAIVVLSAVEWRILRSHLPAIAAALDTAIPGTIQFVECGTFTRKREQEGPAKAPQGRFFEHTTASPPSRPPLHLTWKEVNEMAVATLEHSTGVEKTEKGQAQVAPHWHAQAKEIQKFGTVIADMPHRLDEPTRAKMVGMLNQLLADSIQIRDMYKKHHWQVSGPTFYQLHLLFDKHYEEQTEFVDTIAERIQLLGGVSIAMGGDVAQMAKVQSPPRGREEVPVQISRLLEAHKIIMQECHDIAEAADKCGDDGTNDMAVSDILRPNELQSWFINQHLVEMPLILDK